jgi:hypothetical protein
MKNSLQEKLKQAEQLMYNAKYFDALAIIEDFEKRINKKRINKVKLKT